MVDNWLVNSSIFQLIFLVGGLLLIGVATGLLTLFIISKEKGDKKTKYLDFGFFSFIFGLAMLVLSINANIRLKQEIQEKSSEQEVQISESVETADSNNN